jgi:hypothetical protein
MEFHMTLMSNDCLHCAITMQLILQICLKYTRNFTLCSLKGFVDLKIHTLKILVNELYLMIPIGLLILCNSEENLRAALGKMRVNSRAIEDVMDKVRNRHYQVGILAAAYKFSSKWFSIFLTRCLTFVNNLLKHMQLACTLTFEAVHGTSCDAGINHPNQYFSESQKVVQSKVDPVVV